MKIIQTSTDECNKKNTQFGDTNKLIWLVEMFTPLVKRLLLRQKKLAKTRRQAISFSRNIHLHQKIYAPRFIFNYNFQGFNLLLT